MVHSNYYNASLPYTKFLLISAYLRENNGIYMIKFVKCFRNTFLYQGKITVIVAADGYTNAMYKFVGYTASFVKQPCNFHKTKSAHLFWV